MNINEVTDFIQNKSEEEKLRMKLALHCAPVFAGIKASNCFILSDNEYTMMQDFLKNNILSFYNLCGFEGKNMLLLYREDKLQQLLNIKETGRFLTEAGYTGMNLTDILVQLSKRLNAYHNRYFKNSSVKFPHEIGIILDYPVGDVEAFIKNSGKNELISGYWKVYHDADNARKVFQMYDAAREAAVRQVLSEFYIC